MKNQRSDVGILLIAQYFLRVTIAVRIGPALMPLTKAIESLCETFLAEFAPDSLQTKLANAYTDKLTHKRSIFRVSLDTVRSGRDRGLPDRLPPSRSVDRTIDPVA